MRKALIVTTVSGFVPQFEMDNVKLLKSKGYEIHYASNYNTPVYDKNNDKLDDANIIRHQVDFVRSPYHILQNIKAYKQLEELMRKEKFDLVHCHTPMGGVIARIAAKFTNTFPVLYTAHGFHFFQGSSVLSWVLFYPMEKVLAHFTDVLITINEEDYNIARRFKVRENGRIEHINGVGIDTSKNIHKSINPREKRRELGIEPESFVITSVGELTKRKNHKIVLKAIARLNNKKITYLICGSGELEKELKKNSEKLNIQDQVIFAGYRTDIYEILNSSDCFVFPSLQEGLPVALLEAMVVGLPIICSEIRGNTDLIKNNKGGFLVKPNDLDGYVEAIKNIYQNDKKRSDFGLYNKKTVNEFDSAIINIKMNSIYESLLATKRY